MINKQSILIADDEINLCRILDAELRKAGYLVTAVHDGAQAVDEAHRRDFDMIILDVRMPVMDGISALQSIRRERKDVPIIIMTAYESHDTMASALSMGATACVNKPFDLDSLVALVKATLDDGIGQRSFNWSGSVRTVLFNYSQPLLIEIHDGDYVGQYHSRIEEKDDQTLTIACPSNSSGAIPLKPGLAVSIGFAGEDAFYSFETSILAIRDSYQPMMVVGKPAVIYRVQRRKHARMPARIPAEVALVEKSAHSDVPSVGPLFRVHTQDIGAGGFRIITEQRLQTGATVKIQASNIPGLDEFSGTGKITRAIKVHGNGHEDWEYGIQFTKVDDDQRHTLARAVEAGALA